MIKLFKGWRLLNPQEVFDFVNGSLQHDHGRRVGILDTIAEYKPQLEELEASNKSAQKSWRMSKEYAEGLERIIDRYKDKFREAMLLRLQLQDALKDMVLNFSHSDPLKYGEYFQLADNSPLNDKLPPQYIKKEVKE